MSSVMVTVIWNDFGYFGYFGYGNLFVLLKLDAIWTSWVVLTLDVADEGNLIYIHLLTIVQAPVNLLEC